MTLIELTSSLTSVGKVLLSVNRIVAIKQKNEYTEIVLSSGQSTYSADVQEKQSEISEILSGKIKSQCLIHIGL